MINLEKEKLDCKLKRDINVNISEMFLSSDISSDQDIRPRQQSEMGHKILLRFVGFTKNRGSN